MRLSTVISVAVLMLPWQVVAATKHRPMPPSLLNLKAKSENASGFLIGQCDPSGQNVDYANVHQVTCHLVQLFVRQESVTDIDAMEKQLGGMSDEEVMKQRPNDCAQILEGLTSEKAKASPNEAMRTRVDLMYAAYKEICSATSPKEVRAGFQQVSGVMRQFGEETCKLEPHPYELTFQLESTGVWVAEERPSRSSCGLRNVVTLRRDQSGVLWTYEARKIATDPEPNQNSLENCEEQAKDAALVYAWNGRPFEGNCLSLQ